MSWPGVPDMGRKTEYMGYTTRGPPFHPQGLVQKILNDAMLLTHGVGNSLDRGSERTNSPAIGRLDVHTAHLV